MEFAQSMNKTYTSCCNYTLEKKLYKSLDTTRRIKSPTTKKNYTNYQKKLISVRLRTLYNSLIDFKIKIITEI